MIFTRSVLVFHNRAMLEHLTPAVLHFNDVPRQATMELGVTVDNRLIGVYAFSAASTVVDMSKYVDTPNIYLLSDFLMLNKKQL